MTLLTADSFNRTNSAGTIQSTNGAGTLDPQAWTLQQGTMSINTNNLALGAAVTVGPINGGICTVDLGVSDFSVAFTIPTVANACCLVFRFVDTSNYWYLAHDGSLTKYRKNVGGTVTNMGSTHAGGANGDVIRVVAKGPTLRFYRNEVYEETIVDSAHRTATKVGALVTVTAGPGRMDNFAAHTVGSTYSANLRVAVV